MNAVALFLQLSVQLGTPFLLATLGGIMCEKVGNLNLGIEGMMMMGAFFGFQCAYLSSNPAVGVLMAAIGGVIGAVIYAVITVTLKGNQTVTGFALATFGAGLANFLGKKYLSTILSSDITGPLGTRAIPALSRIPILGTMIFSQSVLVYISIGLAIVMLIYFKRTKFGLSARMIGENPATADASGIHVDRYKYIHIAIGGALCGLGGGYLSLVYVPYWQDNITAGMGWIAVALVIFSAWDPVRAIFGCYFFGVLKALAIKFQGVTIGTGAAQITVSSQIMDMLPYISTVVVLVISAIVSKQRGVGPAAVGQPYYREDR